MINFIWSLTLLSSSSSPSELIYEEIDLATCVAFLGERGLPASFLEPAGLRPRPVVVAGLRTGLAPRPTLPAAVVAARRLPVVVGAGSLASSSSESDTSLNVTVFFLAGPRSKFDLMVVEFVAIRICLGPLLDASTAPVCARVFFFVLSLSAPVVTVGFVAAVALGRPLGLGAASGLTSSSFGSGFVLGRPGRFLGASVWASSSSSLSLSHSAAAGVAGLLPRPVALVEEVELFPLGLPGFAFSFVSMSPSSSSVASSVSESACLVLALVAVAVLVVFFPVSVAEVPDFVLAVLTTGLLAVVRLAALTVLAGGRPRVARFGDDFGMIAARAILNQ